MSGDFEIYDMPGSGLFLGGADFAGEPSWAATSVGRPFTGGTDADGSSMTLNLLAAEEIFADDDKVFDTRDLLRSCTSAVTGITALAEFDNLLDMRNTVAVTENYGDDLAPPVGAPARPQHPVRDSVPILGGFGRAMSIASGPPGPIMSDGNGRMGSMGRLGRGLQDTGARGPCRAEERGSYPTAEASASERDGRCPRLG